jgi:hypothetical protein
MRSRWPFRRCLPRWLRRALDASVFVERLLPAAFTALDAIMARTPLDRLDAYTPAWHARPKPQQDWQFCDTTEHRHHRPDRRPAHAETYSAYLRTAVANLPVASEVRTGYDRSLFPHWKDADGDGCNTRNEVLIAEATTKPSVGSGCSLSGGRWYSYYDNAYWILTSDLDIDHVLSAPAAV